MSDFIEPEQEHSFYNAEEPVYFVPRNEETGLKSLKECASFPTEKAWLEVKQQLNNVASYSQEIQQKISETFKGGTF